MTGPSTGPGYLEEAAAQARAARDANDAMEADVSLLLPWDHPLRVEGRATRLRLAEIFAFLEAIRRGMISGTASLDPGSLQRPFGEFRQ